MLAHAGREPERELGDLRLLPEEEEVPLRAVGEGRPTNPGFVPVHRLFEAHAKKTPSATAVRFRDRSLNYRELDTRATRLAHHFVSLGVSRERPVVVSIEPSLDIAVVLLAILKAGGIYVPLEPTYPPARIRAILDDTQPALIVSTVKLVERLSLGGFPIHHMDRDGLSEGVLPELTTELLPSQTASIYYTSGTTGKPKGVMASQANLAHYLRTARDRYAIDARDIFPAVARFSFSISMFELLSPLTAGGTLVVLEREHVVDLARMTETLKDVTFFHIGPSLLRGLLTHVRRQVPDFEVFSKVRHASSGGDMVPPEVLENLKQIFSKAEVFVIYGCSEISCMGCTFPAPREVTITKTFVGKPFEDVVVRVLDARRRIVPFGIVGEICFSGGGVVKGYLNRDELTREKFVEIEGRRFYCTGDMGRVSTKGDVEILGRRDFQVQLRGMRIELGEIEYTLRKAPGVRDAVAMAREDASGEKALVAYVVYEQANTAGVAAIRKHMVEHLPDYMVPTVYVELPSLPLNHNMKIDRNALPPPPGNRRALTDDARAPAGETEKDLASIWRTLLELDTITLDDNFFELGGYSMLAVRLILEVEKKLGLRLDGMDVLRESLEGLAILIDRRLGKVAEARGRGAALVKSAPVEAFYFGKNESLYGILHGPVGNGAGPSVLVSAPFGQEQARTHFVLHKLARLLAGRGVPVLRFDPFGSGNSLGDTREGSPARWREDVVAAAEVLRQRAPGTKMFVVGARFGATLAMSARAEIDAARWIFWDPIENGASYLREMEAMHARRVKSLHDLRLGRAPRRVTNGRELLGFTYSREAERQIGALRIDASAASDPSIDWVLTTGAGRVKETSRDASPAPRHHFVDIDCQWQDIASMEEVLPDVGLSQAIARLILGSER